MAVLKRLAVFRFGRLIGELLGMQHVRTLYLRRCLPAFHRSAADLLEAEKTFRRLKAYRQLPMLRQALHAHAAKATANSALEAISTAA